MANEFFVWFAFVAINSLYKYIYTFLGSFVTFSIHSRFFLPFQTPLPLFILFVVAFDLYFIVAAVVVFVGKTIRSLYIYFETLSILCNEFKMGFCSRTRTCFFYLSRSLSLSFAPLNSHAYITYIFFFKPRSAFICYNC